MDYRDWIKATLLLLTSSTLGYTQSDLPNFVVGVSVQSGDTIYSGRGVVVSPDLVVTADHVIEVDRVYQTPTIVFGDKHVKASSIVRQWVDRDIALIRVSVPDGIQAVQLGDTESIEAWSFDISATKREYRRCIANKGSNYFDYTPRAGESGGPVFSGDKLIGIVSGGFFWLDDRPNHTWPLRAGRVDVIREYINGSPTKSN